MQYFFVKALDRALESVAGVGYRDAWYAYRGSMTAWVHGSGYSPPEDQLPYSGSATVSMNRVGDSVSVFWNGDMIVAGTAPDTIHSIELEFAFFSYSGAFFGTESVDYISVEGDPITGVADETGRGVGLGSQSVSCFTAHPNPFNSLTTIAYGLGEERPLALRIYDIEGRLVRTLIDHTLSPGLHRTQWDGLDSGGVPVAAGVYFCVANDDRLTRQKIILVR